MDYLYVLSDCKHTRFQPCRILYLSDKLDFLAESTKQEEKPKIFDYQPKEFSPREKTTKSAKKISIVKKAKKKRQTQESKKIGRAGQRKFELIKLK